MKTLDISPYDVVIGKTPEGLELRQAYPIRDSIANILFAQPGLKARDLLRRDDIARKVIAAPEDSVTLDDAEFEQLKAATDSLEGYGRQDVELIRRIVALDAPPSA